MWKTLRAVAIFIAALAGFTLAVLEILKNHLGVDTHLMLVQFGQDTGNTISAIQGVFGDSLRRVGAWLLSVFGMASALAVELTLDILMLILSVLLALVAARQMEATRLRKDQ